MYEKEKERIRAQEWGIGLQECSGWYYRGEILADTH